MNSEALSSNAQRRNQPGGHNPVQDRIRREDERAAQQAAQQAVHQTFPDYPTTSIEAGVAMRTGGVPCFIPALRNERSPKDFKGPRKVPNYTADLQPGRGLKAMRWPWNCWRSVMQQWPSTAP